VSRQVSQKVQENKGGIISVPSKHRRFVLCSKYRIYQQNDI